MKTERINAVYSVHPETKSSDDNGFYNANGEKIVLDEDAVSKKEAELKADYDSKQYQRDRATSYPSIQEQLDMQYWDAVNGTKKWQEAVAKVKTDNPKPE